MIEIKMRSRKRGRNYWWIFLLEILKILIVINLKMQEDLFIN